MTEATRSQLIATGREAFAGQGLEGARVERIAREAGVNKALINYHFQGKGGLYRSVLSELFARVAEELESELPAETDPAARLLAWPETFWSVMDRHPDFAPLFIRELLGACGSLSGESLESTGQSFALLARTLSLGRDQNLIGAAEPFPLGLLLLGALLMAGISDPLHTALGGLLPPEQLAGSRRAVAPMLKNLIERGLLGDAARDPSER